MGTADWQRHVSKNRNEKNRKKTKKRWNTMEIYSPVLNPCPFARKKLFAMYGTATNTIKNDISIFPVFVLLLLLLLPILWLNLFVFLFSSFLCCRFVVFVFYLSLSSVNIVCLFELLIHIFICQHISQYYTKYYLVVVAFCCLCTRVLIVVWIPR